MKKKIIKLLLLTLDICLLYFRSLQQLEDGVGLNDMRLYVLCSIN